MINVKALLALCQFNQWTFELGETNGVQWIRVSDPSATCNESGKAEPWNGRKWMLSQHMTASEIVQTAFKAVMTAMEHETREQFTYDGVAIFGPHWNVEALRVASLLSNAEDVR